MGGFQKVTYDQKDTRAVIQSFEDLPIPRRKGRILERTRPDLHADFMYSIRSLGERERTARVIGSWQGMKP